jgi:hypothetical protein
LEAKLRTTLSIDDDVLAAAKGLAALQQKSVGEVISELARQVLRPNVPKRKTRNGVPLLSVSTATKPVTPEMVRQLSEELL